MVSYFRRVFNRSSPSSDSPSEKPRDKVIFSGLTPTSQTLRLRSKVDVRERPLLKPVALPPASPSDWSCNELDTFDISNEQHHLQLSCRPPRQFSVENYSTSPPCPSISSENSTSSSDCSPLFRPRQPSSASGSTSPSSSVVRSALKCGKSSLGQKASHQPQSHVSFLHPKRSTMIHFHPLLSCSNAQRAPIFYDVAVPPASHSILDFTQKRVPVCTLLEPATDPPTMGKLVLRSEAFPWPVIAYASGNSTLADQNGRPRVCPLQPSKIHHANPAEEHDYPVSNLDVVCAVYTTLSASITQREWVALGSGSLEQKRIGRAYEKRCRKMGGDWDAGVKRIDFLKGQTVLIGVETPGQRRGEVAPSGTSEFSRTGTLVFSTAES